MAIQWSHNHHNINHFTFLLREKMMMYSIWVSVICYSEKIRNWDLTTRLECINYDSCFKISFNLIIDQIPFCFCGKLAIKINSNLPTFNLFKRGYELVQSCYMLPNWKHLLDEEDFCLKNNLEWIQKDAIVPDPATTF
jgi:hypothetical protein